MDVRVGGRRFLGMEMPTPDRVMRMWFVGRFLEIDEPSRLVYSESLADEDGAPPPDFAADSSDRRYPARHLPLF